MKQVIPSPGPRCLALALIGALIAGCGSNEVQVAGGGVGSEEPTPKTERARKAADFERELKTKTRRD